MAVKAISSYRSLLSADRIEEECGILFQRGAKGAVPKSLVFGFASGQGRGVVGVSEAHTGVEVNSTSGVGVWSSSATAQGVVGRSDSWPGVYGHSNNQAGVVGESDTFDGVFFLRSAASLSGRVANQAGLVSINALLVSEFWGAVGEAAQA